MDLYLAPMEELTGYVFRNMISKHFGYVDKYFTPFISPDNKIMKTRAGRELIRENNAGLYVVPQLLSNDPGQFNEAAALIADMGYEEININFGCPSNTVTSKNKGSGILRAPDVMDRFLDGVFDGKDSILRTCPDLRISVKTRVGYNDTSDFEKVLEVLNGYPFYEVIVHPRLKKDLYQGHPRMEMFDTACENCRVPLVYNGDVFSVSDFEEISCKYGKRISAVMIGRGALTDPGLFRQIRTGRQMTKDELYDFLGELYEYYKTDYSPENALSKLKELWSYTVRLIEDEKIRAHVLKSLIKSRRESDYLDAITVAKQHIG